jgi:DNA-binding response OmpR family regulator
MAKILICEDDKSLNASVADVLRSERHTVETVFDGESALDLVETYDYDVLVLDIGLPGMNGKDVCRSARRAGKKCAILMLTGQSEVSQKIEGLDAGADDYLAKPFDWRELVARVRALLRRNIEGFTNSQVVVGNITLDFEARKVMQEGKEIHLTPKEFSLLEFMMRNKGRVFNAETLIARVWPADDDTSAEMIRSHIKNLRKKLDQEGQPSIFRTVHKVGYVVDDATSNK